MAIRCKITAWAEEPLYSISNGIVNEFNSSYEYEYSLFQDVFVVEQNWRGKWVVKQRAIDAFAFTNIPSYHITNCGFVTPDYVFDDYDKAKKFADMLNRK